MRRIKTSRDGHVEFAGRAIDVADGVEMGPSGEELRQVVQGHQRMAWDVTAWCSKDGVVYDRCFDPFRRSFVWSAPRVVGVDAATGHFTTIVGRDSDTKRTVRLTRCIAMAWVEPPRTEVKLQACALPGCEASADALVWVRTGVRDFEYDGTSADPPTPVPSDQDVWRPLKYVWRSICGEIVHRVDESTKAAEDAYHVSARGWVRSPFGGVLTKGVRSVGGRMYACMTGVGAFWVDEAVLCTFGGGGEDGDEGRSDGSALPPDGIVAKAVHINSHIGDNAFENLRWDKFAMTQVRHDETAAMLASGGTLGDMCAAAGIRKTTAWGRVVAAAWELPYARAAEVFGPIAVRSVRTELRRLLASGELDAADTVATCVTACDTALKTAENRTWALLDEHDRYGVVQLCRALELRSEARRGEDAS